MEYEAIEKLKNKIDLIEEKYDKRLNQLEKENKFMKNILLQNINENKDILNKFKNINEEHNTLLDIISKYERIIKNDDYITYNVREEDKDKDGYVKILGQDENATDFVKENKNNCYLIINDKKVDLCYKYKLK